MKISSIVQMMPKNDENDDVVCCFVWKMRNVINKYNETNGIVTIRNRRSFFLLLCSLTIPSLSSLQNTQHKVITSTTTAMTSEYAITSTDDSVDDVSFIRCTHRLFNRSISFKKSRFWSCQRMCHHGVMIVLIKKILPWNMKKKVLTDFYCKPIKTSFDKWTTTITFELE